MLSMDFEEELNKILACLPHGNERCANAKAANAAPVAVPTRRSTLFPPPRPFSSPPQFAFFVVFFHFLLYLFFNFFSIIIVSSLPLFGDCPVRRWCAGMA